MRSAEEWHFEWVRMAVNRARNDGTNATKEDLLAFVRAIQADAIKAAASVASELGDDWIEDRILKLLEPSP